jgi:NAD(P)-dependent dehydrogenase (short-subunit alcohol dehydrogenase family)
MMGIKTLDGDVAIVTGARRGIGRAIALSFAEAGAAVCVIDAVTDDGKLYVVAEEIKKLGQSSLALGVDITHKAEVEDMIHKVIGELGKIDILVNCAGMWIPGQTIVECDEYNWDIVLNTNLKGTYLCCQAAAREMIKRKRGRIISIASDLAIYPIPGVGAYSVAKAGIIMLTQQLAIELGEYGIRVNAIAPGMVKTDMNTKIRSSPEVEEQFARKMVLGRLGEPIDIAKTALFLACDGSDLITGQTVVANSGGIIPSLF